MMSPCRIAAAAAVSAAIATGAVTSSASAAAGEKTLAQTFPVASRICAATAAGTERTALKPFAASILADCAALQSAFTGASTTVVAARTAINAQIATEKAAITAACPRPHSHRPACVLARRTHGATLSALHKQRRAAVQLYYTQIDVARHAFWTAFHSLPPAHNIKADAPVPVQNT
jgi:hypothetical protein